ncbi:MAG: YbhB/YbcL family Raf kinase inhibitor-like protein [Pseudomonadota bacterium]
MRLWSDSFRDGGLMPADYAFAALDGARQVRPAANRNPHLAWDEVPAGTESLVLFCFDVDAPRDASGANRPGSRITVETARRDFFHWSVIDMPAAQGCLRAGQYSSSIVARGKRGPGVGAIDGHGAGLRQGINDFGAWYADDAAMAGEYYGYDGPSPPWNDDRIHHYIFRLYALDVARLPLGPIFTGGQARAAIHGHILDEAQLIAAYSLNPELAATLKT